MEKRANSPTCADLVEIFYEQAKLQQQQKYPKSCVNAKKFFVLLILPFPCPLLCEPFVTLYATLISSSLQSAYLRICHILHCFLSNVFIHRNVLQSISVCKIGVFSSCNGDKNKEAYLAVW